jgi:hypothetical protein
MSCSIRSLAPRLMCGTAGVLCRLPTGVRWNQARSEGSPPLLDASSSEASDWRAVSSESKTMVSPRQRVMLGCGVRSSRRLGSYIESCAYGKCQVPFGIGTSNPARFVCV